MSLDAAGRSGANPLQDKNMRLAITHALDRNALAKVLRGEASEVIHSPCNPRQFGCVQDVVKYDHNIAKAKEYLGKVNLPRDYEIKISAYPENATMGEAIAGELRNIGINAKLDARETSAWVHELFAGRSPAAVISWPSNGVYDVVALTPLFFQGDQGDYTRDLVVMEAFKKAATLTDEQERLKLYGQGFKRLADEAFVVPLMTGIMHYAYRRGLDFTVPVDGYPILYMTGWK